MGNNCLARVSSFAVIQRNSIEIIRISGFDEIWTLIVIRPRRPQKGLRIFFKTYIFEIIAFQGKLWDLVVKFFTKSLQRGGVLPQQDFQTFRHPWYANFPDTCCMHIFYDFRGFPSFSLNLCSASAFIYLIMGMHAYSWFAWTDFFMWKAIHILCK